MDKEEVVEELVYVLESLGIEVTEEARNLLIKAVAAMEVS